ncbi:MAG: glycosyltransferase family 2 protein [Acidimicrobiales bacterium]
MTLVMTLLVRDELELVGRNILFHLERGVDRVVAIDNASTDGTRELLGEMSRSAPITIIDEPGRDYDQSTWVTRAALYARDRMGADWVLNNDADEFWVSKGGSLKDVIASATADNLLLCPRRNMIWGYDSPDDQPWYERLVYRVAAPVEKPALRNIYDSPLPCPYFYLDLPPKALVRTEGLVKVAQGNHAALFDTPASAVEAPIDIFHFPARSRNQFEKKIVQGGQAYERNKRFPESTGWHWRRWYRLYRNKGIDAALADALPSTAALARDLQNGVAVQDHGFASIMGRTYLGLK